MCDFNKGSDRQTERQRWKVGSHARCRQLCYHSTQLRPPACVRLIYLAEANGVWYTTINYSYSKTPANLNPLACMCVFSEVLGSVTVLTCRSVFTVTLVSNTCGVMRENHSVWEQVTSMQHNTTKLATALHPAGVMNKKEIIAAPSSLAKRGLAKHMAGEVTVDMTELERSLYRRHSITRTLHWSTTWETHQSYCTRLRSQSK